MSLTNAILIVEQESAIAEVLTELLTDEGYRTSSASTGRTGLAAIAVDTPALTLFDMALPDLSANELISRLHVMDLGDMPLVLMSTMPQSVVPLLVPGRIEALAKPFDLTTLLALVARFAQPRSILQDADTCLVSSA